MLVIEVRASGTTLSSQKTTLKISGLLQKPGVPEERREAFDRPAKCSFVPSFSAHVQGLFRLEG